MKLFRCQACGQVLYFENTRCESCGRRLGYLPELGTMSATISADNTSPRNIFDIENLTATITRLIRAVTDFTQCDAHDTF